MKKVTMFFKHSFSCWWLLNSGLSRYRSHHSGSGWGYAKAPMSVITINWGIISADVMKNSGAKITLYAKYPAFWPIPATSGSSYPGVSHKSCWTFPAVIHLF